MESEVVLAATDNRPNDNAHVPCGGPAPTYHIPSLSPTSIFSNETRLLKKMKKKTKNQFFFLPPHHKTAHESAGEAFRSFSF
jgi:hypothetical protein